MAEALILSNFTVNNWQWDDQLGAYGAMAEKTFSLHVGETYRLVCNGVSYEPSAAQDVSAVLGAPAAAVGGLEAIGLPGNGSTFIIGDIDIMGSNMFLHTGAAYGSPPGACTFSLYRVGGSVDENGIQLKDRDGAPLIYEGITGGINVLRADGTEALYVDAEGVPELVTKNVTLDFSGGGMTVTPAKGQALSAVNIAKPSGLVPDNIAQGVNIAGIIGTLVAGGGGSGPIVFATGTVGASASASAITIYHKLGVVPDIAVLFPQAKLTTTSPIMYCYNFSAAMYARAAGALAGYLYTPNMSLPLDAGTALDTTDTMMGYLANADVQKMSVGGALKLEANKNYVWIAIGGLT